MTRRDGQGQASVPSDIILSMGSFERCVVLVADDEPGILQIVSYVLQRHGYEVIPAPDGPSMAMIS